MTAATGRKGGRPKNIDNQYFQDNSADGVPTPPTGLKVNGKKDWERIWTVGTWLSRDQHYLMVRQYCEKVDEIIQWQKELKSFPNSIYQQANGAWSPYPQVRLIQEGRAQLVAWLSILRLTPDTMPENAAEDPDVKEARFQDRGEF